MGGRGPAFGRNAAGNVAMMFALLAPALLVVIALAVDLAALGHKKRELQNASDLAAILAVQNLDDYHATALTNLAVNGFDIKSVETGKVDESTGEAEEILRTKAIVETGRYRPNPRIAPALRFTPGGTPANSVRVTASYKAELFFGAGITAAPELSASSVAYSASEAAFSVGTRLVHLNGGVANTLLNALLGTNVELSVMDYEDLLDADVSLFPALDALNTEAHLNAATYEEVLAGEITLAELSAALADIVPANDHAADALNVIAADAGARATSLRLEDLLDLGSLSSATLGTVDGPYTVKVRALDMLAAGAGLATGERQVELDLAGNIPGLADLRATLLIGERPQGSRWLSLTGSRDVHVQTAQTRLLLEAGVGGSGLLAGTAIHLPIYVELAEARARLVRVDCPAGREENAEVTLSIVPSVGRVWIGAVPAANLASFGADLPVQRAALVDTALLDVYARAQVDIGGHRGRLVKFTAEEIRNGTVKTVESRRMVEAIVISLLGDLDLRVETIGLSLASPQQIQYALAMALMPVADPLDEVLDTVLSVAGVSVGEADVRVSGLYCQRGVLVQ